MRVSIDRFLERSRETLTRTTQYHSTVSSHSETPVQTSIQMMMPPFFPVNRPGPSELPSSGSVSTSLSPCHVPQPPGIRLTKNTKTMAVSNRNLVISPPRTSCGYASSPSLTQPKNSPPDLAEPKYSGVGFCAYLVRSNPNNGYLNIGLIGQRLMNHRIRLNTALISTDVPRGK